MALLLQSFRELHNIQFHIQVLYDAAEIFYIRGQGSLGIKEFPKGAPACDTRKQRALVFDFG